MFQFPKNEAYLFQLAQERGLLRSQADLVAKLAKNVDQLEDLAQNSHFLEVMAQVERFVSIWLKDQMQAYLALNRLVLLATEKEEQELVLTLLTLLLAREQSQTPFKQLEAVYQARLMWQSNVNFQNTLEYMVMS